MMMPFVKELHVYTAAPAWSYTEESGERREHSLHVDFLEDSHAGAVEAAIVWAKERHEALMGDYGKNSVLSSIKVFEKRICRPDGNGHISTGLIGFSIFEWKNDWPGTLEDWVGMKMRKMVAGN